MVKPQYPTSVQLEPTDYMVIEQKSGDLTITIFADAVEALRDAVPRGQRLHMSMWIEQS